jgi:hypothetical protein
MCNPHKLTKSVDDAVDILLSDLSLNCEIHMAAMKEEDIIGLHFSWFSDQKYVRPLDRE